MDYLHTTEFKVRDYECDMQGVVNNGVYQNYLEHARHELLLAHGINFAEVTATGINLVVIKAVLEYKNSLVSNNCFVICSNVQQVSRLRYEFQQDIYRQPGQHLIMNAVITATAVNSRGRPVTVDFLQLLLGEK